INNVANPKKKGFSRESLTRWRTSVRKSRDGKGFSQMLKSISEKTWSSVVNVRKTNYGIYRA
ncbi:hypothetical protein, partial [Pseudomonas aeruginosa]|uniref:hypothetical protein n=1 Tax=Pseudomonas aeruginosa TaxID=287 RepID=UPI0038922716